VADFEAISARNRLYIAYFGLKLKIESKAVIMNPSIKFFKKARQYKGKVAQFY